MSAAHQLAPDDVADDVVDDDAPPIDAEEHAAFARWSAAHPSPAAPSRSVDHARWMLFWCERLIAAQRARVAARPAVSAAPPATSTTSEMAPCLPFPETR